MTFPIQPLPSRADLDDDLAPPAVALGPVSSASRSRTSLDPQAVDDVVEELARCEDPHLERTLRDQLVDLHLGLASSIAMRYRNRGIDDDDLRQVAHLGLTKASRRFDASAGHPFVSFSAPTIRGELRRHFRDLGWMVRPPRRVQELQPRLTRAVETLTGRLKRRPSDGELSDFLGVSPDEVREAAGSNGCFTPASLDRPIGDEDGATTLGDLLPDQSVDHSPVEARTMLAPHVRQLSPHDRHILQLRFFRGLTQREIADDIGVTQMQVSRLLTRILRQLRTSVGPLDT